MEEIITTDSSADIVNEYNDPKNQLKNTYDYITQGIIVRSRATWYEHGEKSSKYFLNLAKRNKSKSHLRYIYDYITQRIIVRSCVTWYEHREKSSKYFLNLEKRNKPKSHLRKLLLPDGSKTEDPQTLMSNIQEFYESLYRRRSTKSYEECLSYLEDMNLPQLCETDIAACEGLVTKNECFNALKAMNSKKSTGNNGSAKEFYLAFFDALGNYLVEAIKFSFQEGGLSTSQKKAVITRAQKKGWRLLKHWRPNP